MNVVVILKSLVSDANTLNRCSQISIMYVNYCRKLRLAHDEKVLNTLLLHGIGSNKKIVGSTESERTYNYLKKSQYVYANVYKTMGCGVLPSDCNKIDEYVKYLLDYCITHVGYTGNIVSLDDKKKEILSMYGDKSTEYRNFVDSEDYFALIEMDIEQNIKTLHKLISNHIEV